MAYAATVTVDELSGTGGHRSYRILVAESGAGATSQWDTGGIGTGVTLAGGVAAGALPQIITIVSRKVLLTAGTGTTVAPIFSRATGAIAAGAADYLDGFTAAAYVDDIAHVPRRLGSTPNIFGRSTPNAGTDNAITTEIILVGGVL